MAVAKTRDRHRKILVGGHLASMQKRSRPSRLPVAIVHRVKGLVDVIQSKVVGDELVNLNLAGHVVLDKSRQLSAALDTAKR